MSSLIFAVLKHSSFSDPEAIVNAQKELQKDKKASLKHQVTSFTTGRAEGEYVCTEDGREETNKRCREHLDACDSSAHMRYKPN